MRGSPADHDRDTSVVDRGTADALQVALERLRLEGAVFLMGEYTEAWAYESPTAEMTTQLLSPGSERVILFHVIAAGRCWVRVGDGEKFWCSAGDVVVLPYGDQHVMGGALDADVVSMVGLLDPPPWTRMPVVRHGEDGGARTEVVCGYLHSRDPMFDPAMRVFPPVFVIQPPPGAAREWVRANVAYALEQTSVNAAGRLAGPTRLPEMLLVEVLRLHLASAPAIERGWVAALRDPVLAPALAELHRAPGHKWTVAELATSANVSRSLLDERFREVLGLSPIRYLAEWRMHAARDLLAGTDLGVAVIARRVGYDAEEAFSRAFKRAYGSSPAIWRVNRSRN